MYLILGIRGVLISKEMSALFFENDTLGYKDKNKLQILLGGLSYGYQTGIIEKAL